MKKEENKFPVIECEYDGDNYNDAIERALRKHGYQKGQCTVICKPKKEKKGRRNKRR